MSQQIFNIIKTILNKKKNHLQLEINKLCLLNKFIEFEKSYI